MSAVDRPATIPAALARSAGVTASVAGAPARVVVGAGELGVAVVDGAAVVALEEEAVAVRGGPLLVEVTVLPGAVDAGRVDAGRVEAGPLELAGAELPDVEVTPAVVVAVAGWDAEGVIAGGSAVELAESRAVAPHAATASSTTAAATRPPTCRRRISTAPTLAL